MAAPVVIELDGGVIQGAHNLGRDVLVLDWDVDGLTDSEIHEYCNVALVSEGLLNEEYRTEERSTWLSIQVGLVYATENFDDYARVNLESR